MAMSSSIVPISVAVRCLKEKKTIGKLKFKKMETLDFYFTNPQTLPCLIKWVVYSH